MVVRAAWWLVCNGQWRWCGVWWLGVLRLGDAEGLPGWKSGPAGSPPPPPLVSTLLEGVLVTLLCLPVAPGKPRSLDRSAPQYRILFEGVVLELPFRHSRLLS